MNGTKDLAFLSGLTQKMRTQFIQELTALSGDKLTSLGASAVMWLYRLVRMSEDYGERDWRELEHTQ